MEKSQKKLYQNQNNGKLFGIYPREISSEKIETNEIFKTKSSFKIQQQRGKCPREKILRKFSYAKYLKLKKFIFNKNKTYFEYTLEK